MSRRTGAAATPREEQIRAGLSQAIPVPLTDCTSSPEWLPYGPFSLQLTAVLVK